MVVAVAGVLPFLSQNGNMDYISALDTVKKMKTDKIATWPFIDEPCLSSLLPRILGPVSCGEYVDITMCNLKVDGEDLGPINELNVARLIELATPSQFGRGTETVFDPNIRNGLEIGADRIVLVHGGKNTCTKVCDEVAKYASQDLLQEHDDRCSITAKLIKMTIYAKGGGFEWHADTLHGNTHVGTALVGIPSKHTGGALLVSDGNVVSSYSFEGDEDAQYEMKTSGFICLSACAFYTDCQHKVECIESGVRLALQFDLHDKTDDSDSDDEYELDGFLDSRLEDEYSNTQKVEGKGCTSDASESWAGNFVVELGGWFEEHPGKSIAIMARHYYSGGQIRDQNLKGYDKVFFDLFKDTCNIRVFPAVLQLTPDEGNPTAPFDRNSKVYPLPIGENDKPDNSISACVIHDFRRYDMKYIDSTDYIEYTGNQAQSAEARYLTAVFVFSPE